MMLLKSEPNSEFRVAEILKQGKIAILPTDTVYGFSGIAFTFENQLHTDKTIAQIKGRDEGKPLIELISAPKDVYNYTDCRLPDELFEQWPGPLTVIVENNARYKTLTGRDTTAFRCPGDEWLRKVIALCGMPLYSTSVNRSGAPVLEKIADIRAEFGGFGEFGVEQQGGAPQVALIVDDGDKVNAKPSRIVTLVGGELRVVRG